MNLVEIIVKVDGTAARAEMAALEHDIRDSADRQQTVWDRLGHSMASSLGDAVKNAGTEVDTGLHDIEAATQDSANRQTSIWRKMGDGIARGIGDSLRGVGHLISGFAGGFSRKKENKDFKGQGILGRIGSGLGDLAGTAGKGISSALSGLPSILGGIAGINFNGIPVGIALLGGLAAAATAAAIALFPLIANLGLIGVGIAGFALLAKPLISSVFTALSEHGKKLAATLKTMTPAERDLVKATEPLKDEFGKLQKAIQPYVVKAFAEGIRILKELFPAFAPLVKAAGKALDGFLKHIADWLKSSSGKKFIHWMETEGPHALEIFGRAMWRTLQIVGQVFDGMYRFGKRFLYDWRADWHNAANALDVIREASIKVGHEVESIWNSTVHAVNNDIDDWRKFFVGAGHDIEAIWNSIAGAADHAASTIAGAVSRIIGAISSINSHLGGVPGKVLSLIGLEHGGVVGAALGGVHGGLRLVGEHGPEMVRLPTGSNVFSNPDTQRMLGGAGGGQPAVILEVATGGNASFERFMATWIRQYVRVKGGGNVQSAFGWQT